VIRSPLVSRILSLFGFAGSLAVLAVAVWLVPDRSGHGTHVQLGLPPCGYLESTGDPCVTCGMTTAFAALAEGSLGLAWRANPMGIVLFFVTCGALAWCGHGLWTGSDPLRFVFHSTGRWLLPALVLGIVACWAVRV